MKLKELSIEYSSNFKRTTASSSSGNRFKDSDFIKTPPINKKIINHSYH